MIVGKKAFMISGSGEVVCLDITDGKIVWKVSGKSFRHQPGMWGTSECPLVIDGKKVIYTLGKRNDDRSLGCRDW
mgnify:CR=1 FL=1